MEKTPPKKRNIIPKEVWAAIEEGCRTNVPTSQLSEKYCVKQETIEDVAQKKGWLTPRKIIGETLRQVDYKVEMTLNEEKSLAPPRRLDWTEAAVDYRNMIFNKVEAALKEASLEPPKTWRDAEIADRMARKAVGLESGETTVVQTIIPIGKGDFGVERDVSPAQPQ